MSAAAKEELVTTLENKSTREVERELVQRNPQVLRYPQMLRQEKVCIVAEDKVVLRMVINAELKAKIDQLKAFRSHKNPNMSYRELLSELAELGLKKWDPERNSNAAFLGRKSLVKTLDVPTGTPRIFSVGFLF